MTPDAWTEYQNLKSKFRHVVELLQAHQKKIENLAKYGNVITDKKGNSLFLKKRGNILYLLNSQAKDNNHCHLCLKKRETKAHHIIPQRLYRQNKEFYKDKLLPHVRIRLCKECHEAVHPENQIDGFKIMEKQSRTIKWLKTNIKSRNIKELYPMQKFIDGRIKKLEAQAKSVDKNPKLVTPEMKKLEKARVYSRIVEAHTIKSRMDRLIEKYVIKEEDDIKSDSKKS
jgi:cytochrome c peroxidase